MIYFLFKLNIQNQNNIPTQNPPGGIINPHINDVNSLRSINTVILKEINDDGKNEYEKIKKSSETITDISIIMNYQSEQILFIEKTQSKAITNINISKYKKNYKLSIILIHKNNQIIIPSKLKINDNTANIFDASGIIYPLSTSNIGESIKIDILYSEPFYYYSITHYK